MPIRALVWNENIHEQKSPVVAGIYPDGIHNAVARLLRQDQGISVETATLQEPEHGLTAQRLESTDVLLWWGHMAHGDVDDEIVERVAVEVWRGMGLIALHSSHFSKIFKRLMGTTCALKWREAGERERLWTVSPGHPIARGVPASFVLENEEMYGEPFGIPDPDNLVFISWFQGGEVFRSGATWRRGAGNVFYFRPGHEAYPTYHDATVGQVLRNAVRWAHNPERLSGEVRAAPNVPVEEAPETITARGESVHEPGSEGFK